MTDVTQILNAIDQGDPQAADRLLPLVYEELRKLAAHKMAQEAPGQTLQATALVHEAYVRLVKGDCSLIWDSRGHFFAAAAEAMRRILVDEARRKKADKRGGDRRRVDLAGTEIKEELTTPPELDQEDQLLALDAALRQLESEDPIKARLVQLRYFAGLSMADAAQALGLSLATAKRHWIYARSWLYGQIRGR